MEFTKSAQLALISGGIVVALALCASVYFYLLAPQPASEVPTIDTGPDVAAQVSGAVETPAEKLPQTNPFSDYKNPFE